MKMQDIRKTLNNLTAKFTPLAQAEKDDHTVVKYTEYKIC
jgi:hypothetical protein